MTRECCSYPFMLMPSHASLSFLPYGPMCDDCRALWSRELRARADAAMPGSPLKSEYRQRACGVDQTHDFRYSQPGWQECRLCHLVRQTTRLREPWWRDASLPVTVAAYEHFCPACDRWEHGQDICR